MERKWGWFRRAVVEMFRRVSDLVVFIFLVFELVLVVSDVKMLLFLMVLGEGVKEEVEEKFVRATKKGSAVLDQWLPDHIKSHYHVISQVW